MSSTASVRSVRSLRAKANGWLGLRVLALVAVIPAFACTGEQHEISVETLELASGEYFGLSWGGTQVERFHVLAHSGTRDGDVVVISPQQEQPCSLGQLSGYTTLQPFNGGKYVLGSPSPARVAVFDEPDAEGRARLGFADLECKRLPLELPDIVPSSIRRLFRPDLMQMSLAIPTQEGELLFVDPWAETITSVAKDVESVRPDDSGVWLVQAGRAVRYDLDGKQLARFGSGVRELLPLGGPDDVAYVDERGLVLRRDGKDKKIDADGCRVRSLGGFMQQALGYFSPCDSHTFVVRDKDGKLHRYEDIESLAALSGKILFTRVEEDTTALFMVLAGEPKKELRLGERPTLRLDTFWVQPASKLLLASRQPDNTFELLTFYTKGEPRLSVVDDGIVAISAYEGAFTTLKQNGDFSLFERASLRLVLRASGVTGSGFRFAFGGDATALAYVSDVDPDTKLGQLELQFLTGEHFTLAKNVREFREVWWPETGILYAAGGANPGLRFARVDVPCEVTSDSPWACGF